MIVVINCGGSGSRLWPLSTPDYPKHLLKIPGIGGDGSLLQNTYNRVRKFADDVYFITEEGHAHQVKEQLPDVKEENVIIEPARRGTASCLLLALSQIKKVHGENIPLAFVHADHIIHDEESHQSVFEYAANVASENQAITLIGIEPAYPSTGVGYIEKGERLTSSEKREVFEVSSFKEKPNREKAEEFIETGRYLWNMGSFVATAKTFIDTMQSSSPNLHSDFQKLDSSDNKEETYLELADEAIDYALIEKADRLQVVPGSFDWMDVGNFQDLHSASSHDGDGNAVNGKAEIEDMSNSYIQNNTDINVAVIGLDNVAVVVTEKGILVTNRNYSQKVGNVSKRFLNK